MEEPWLKEEEKEFRRFYRLSLWWVEHRDGLRKTGLWLFVIAEALLAVWVVWMFASVYVIGPTQERPHFDFLVNGGQQDLRAYSSAQAAEPLESEPVSVFSLGEGRYDLFTFVVNPNKDWYATFTYRFVSSDIRSGAQRVSILPDEEKPLAAFAIEATSPPRGGELEISDVVWHRIDAHVIQDIESWKEERLALAISEAVLTQEDVLENKPLTRTTFRVENKTGFSYYDPQFFLLLKRGGRVVGVNQTILDSLDAGEQKEVVVNWFGAVASAAQVEIIPQIDLFSLATYKPLQGEASIDTRTRVFQRR